MYNYFMLVGIVVQDAVIREVAEGKKVVKVRLAVKREFQNMNGEYDTDFIDVTLWELLAENSIDYLKKGARIGVKGRICPKKSQVGETTVYTNELYADRLIFCGEASPIKSTNKEKAE